jgi:hypothetical protein
MAGPNSSAAPPSAKDLMEQFALKEAEEATLAMRERTAAQNEKQALRAAFET